MDVVQGLAGLGQDVGGALGSVLGAKEYALSVPVGLRVDGDLENI